MRMRGNLHRLAQRARLPDDSHQQKESTMADSVYRVTEVIGSSTESWEAAAASAVATAGKTVRDLRIAEVIRQDVSIEDGAVKNYRVRLALSFKYESGE
jgi:dodecin